MTSVVQDYIDGVCLTHDKSKEHIKTSKLLKIKEFLV
jgi:hypothetical protein